MTALYRASWASFPAGFVVYGFGDAGDTYHDRIRAGTVGVARMLTRFRAEADAEGRFAKDAAEPSRYRALFDLRSHKGTRLDVVFAARDGKRIAERAPDDMSHKPLLAEEFRRDVVDPISAFAGIRAHLRAKGAVAGDRFTIAVFDDTRRFDAEVAVTGAGSKTEPIRLHLELKPIAGFKKISEEKSDDIEDTPRPVELMFSSDGKLLPLRLTAPIAFLPLTVEFDHLCADFASCE